MADIRVQPRSGTPPWVWIVGLVLLLLVALVLIDLFVTNYFLGRPDTTADPFGAVLALVPSPVS
jgi:hypothetical protein